MIIGVSGKSGSGKDAFARELTDNYGFISAALADPLKQATAAMYGFTDAQLYGDLKNVIDPFWHMTPREAMQDLGKRMRDRDQDHWIKAAFRRMTGPGNYVVTDVRYANEAEAFYYRAAKLVRIERPNNPNALPSELAAHASETELDTWNRWDRVIVNCLDIKHLRAMAAGLATEWAQP